MQFLQTSVAGQASGVAHQAGGGGVVRMLVLIGMRRQHDPGLKAADLAGDGEGVFGAVAEVAIAAGIRRMVQKMVQENEFGSHDAGGRVGFLDAPLRRAVTRGLAFGKHRDADLVPFVDLLNQQRSAAELDVVGVGPYGQNLHRLRLQRS